MSTVETFDHSEFLARIDAYLAGGLHDEAAEREAFHAQAESCPICAAALAEATAADAAVRGLFDDHRPDAQFEERLLRGIRNEQIRPAMRIVHPIVRRCATGVAAAILIAAVGYVGQRAMETP